MDYTDQRYYNPWFGRFNSPDPMKGGNAADPTSWNKYSYAGGDPVNEYDPAGTDYFSPNDCVSWEWDASQNGNPCGQASPGSYCPSFLSGAQGFGDPLVALTCLSPAIGLAFAPQQAAPVLDCGESLTATGILPTSGTGDDLADVLLGENSWSKIGTQQYQNGDAYRHPTGLTITAGAVATEDNLMLDVIANLASARDVSLSQEASSGAFLGYGAGQTKFSTYQTSAVGSSACNDLTEVSLAVDSFMMGGSVARTSYNQWRGVVQRNPRTGKYFVRHQNPGDLRVGGTDFFTVANP